MKIRDEILGFFMHLKREGFLNFRKMISPQETQGKGREIHEISGKSRKNPGKLSQS